MADFYAIITNFGSAPRANAHLDVSVDTQAGGGLPIDVLYNVYDSAGGQMAEFTVPTNPNGFSSSALAPAPNRNLFRVTNGAPAVVRARTPQTVSAAAAVLHQRGQGSRMVLAAPQARKSDGTPFAMGKVFAIALGDVESAALLIANVSGAEVTADVFQGTRGITGGGKHTKPVLTNHTHWRVDLQPDDENSNLIVVASGDVIVQLMIDDGRCNGVTCLPL